MTLKEIKQAIEKLTAEECFELARRLSARYPELCRDQVDSEEERRESSTVSGEKK